MKREFSLKLYLVTDRDGLEENVFLAKIEAALKNGVTMVQLREKSLDGGDYFRLAMRVKELTDARHVPLIIDDRVDIALAADAAGVHVGQRDLPAGAARKLLGPGKLLGVSAKTVEQAKQAEFDGADYLGVGAIYPTTTKVITKLTSPETLKEICASVSIPVAAIGGLNADNLSILSGIGLAGICVVSAIMKQNDSGGAAARLWQKAEELLSPQEESR